MHYSDAYINVNRGLLEAPVSVQDAYLEHAIRYILEALLLDPATPEQVYADLLGWSYEEVDLYRNYFFCVPKILPRLKMYSFIESFPKVTQGDLTRYTLMRGVFEYGWPFVDSEYNRGANISVQSRAIHSLKKMFGQIDRMVVDCMASPNTTNVQNLIRLLKTSIELEEKGRGDSRLQLEFDFVKRIEEEGQKNIRTEEEIMGLDFDELQRLKPADKNPVIQTELTEIYKDVKDDEDKN